MRKNQTSSLRDHTQYQANRGMRCIALSGRIICSCSGCGGRNSCKAARQLACGSLCMVCADIDDSKTRCRRCEHNETVVCQRKETICASDHPLSKPAPLSAPSAEQRSTPRQTSAPAAERKRPRLPACPALPEFPVPPALRRPPAPLAPRALRKPPACLRPPARRTRTFTVPVCRSDPAQSSAVRGPIALRGGALKRVLAKGRLSMLATGSASFSRGELHGACDMFDHWAILQMIMEYVFFSRLLNATGGVHNGRENLCGR